MLEVIAMRGYPGSGKSTIARELATSEGLAIVSRDTIREQMFGPEYSKPETAAENLVTKVQDAQIRAFLEAGVSVIIDDCNVNPAYIKRFQKIAAMRGADDFQVLNVDTPADVCRTRNAKRKKAVPDSVISRMAKRWPISDWKPIEAEVWYPVREVTDSEQLAGLANYGDAYIFDVDGTLAIKGDRSPYDYSKVSQDRPNRSVVNLAYLINHAEYVGGRAKIIVMSGREGTDQCWQDTNKWLIDAGIEFEDLIMRPEGDTRPDWVVKAELFDKHIRGQYNVLGCVDDRLQVIENCWRAMGLTCFDVAGNTF